MSIVTSLALLAGVFVAALLLTGITRRALERAAIMDRPNDRSLHEVPVPRGGGLVIAVLVLALQGVLLARGALEGHSWAWWWAAAGFAALGWSDDVKPRAAYVRLLAQCLMAGLYVGYLAATRWAAPPLPLAMLTIVGLLATVWTVNLFNFMDGADGFAATQTLCAMVPGALLLLHAGTPQTAMVALTIAAASGGFLVWNWFPARIFLGDVGSYFLGFQFAALGLVSTPQSAILWCILLMPFIVDATLTLGVRLWRRQRWSQAHREHGYQVLVLGGLTPPRLCAALLALNATACWPFAVWSYLQPAFALPALCGAGVLNAVVWLVVRRRQVKPVRSASA